MQGILKGKTTQFDVTEQASKPDIGILELSDWEFKTTLIKMLGTPMDKVDSIQEQMGDVSRELGILRRNQKEMLEIKNTVAEVKNAFDGLISRLGYCFVYMVLIKTCYKDLEISLLTRYTRGMR